MSKNRCDIRKMCKEDISCVQEIERSLFSRPWSQQAFLQAMEQDTLYLVALEDSRVAGYCGMYCSFEEGEITNVAVATAKQNLGIGRTMMEELLRQARERGITHLFLEVRVSNEKAIRLYRSLGFENCGIRKDFYEMPREDGMIMVLEQ